MQRFEGRTAVVTGAAHGIGEATARRLAEEGARVAVLDVRGADQSAARLIAAGARAIGCTADVSNASEVAGAVAEVVERLGPVDVLVNNAGVLLAGDALAVTLEQWRRTFAVNVEGLLLMTRAVLPGMIERGAGAIVNTASVGGLFGVGGLSAYAASKGAVVNITRQLATDYRRRGVRVNCVCPGWVPTGFNDPMLAGTSDEELAALVDRRYPPAVRPIRRRSRLRSRSWCRMTRPTCPATRSSSTAD